MATTLDLIPHGLIGLPRASLTAIRTALLRDAGWEYVGWLQEMGRAGGPAVVASFSAWLASRGDERPLHALDVPSFQALALEYFRETGWGTLTMGALGDGLVALDSDDWAEADPASALPHPGCHVTAGLLGAFFSSVGGQVLVAMEVECRSTGALRCRWLLGNTEAIAHVYEAMARGESYEAAAATLA
jgi:predicted hydrocarbon binding protein